jgi:hypothetical protein
VALVDVEPPAMSADSLVHDIQGTKANPDPTASADFETLRVLRRKFSRGGLPADRKPEDDARIAAFYVLKALLELLAEFSRRVRRGERLRLCTIEHPSTPGRMLVEIRVEPANPKNGGIP